MIKSYFLDTEDTASVCCGISQQTSCQRDGMSKMGVTMGKMPQPITHSPLPSLSPH